MGDLELGAAIEAGARALRLELSGGFCHIDKRCEECDCQLEFAADGEALAKLLEQSAKYDRHTTEAVLTAAYPHVERAVIQRLIEKLDTQIDMALLGGDEDDIIATEWQERALDWLRAELEGGDGRG